MLLSVITLTSNVNAFLFWDHCDKPKDVFNYLHLNHEDGLKVVSDKRINFVSFTGSVKAGYDVHRATHTKFIDMALELGGKDPAYARYDCDLDKTVENLVDGSFFNSGQSCCGIERIYVDEKINNNYFNHIGCCISPNLFI